MSTTLSKEEAHQRLGSITRELHEALNILGSNQLNAVVGEIPDARDRLTHVGKMTEEAANKVLTLVEDAKPACDDQSRHGAELQASLTRIAQNPDQHPDRIRVVLQGCAKFAERSSAFAAQQSETLSQIMLAQDFQDLSGQVIKKVIDVINRTELQLTQLLLDSAPGTEGTDPASPSDAMSAGYQLEGPRTADKSLQQGDVDDLLASLGF